jgi:hypothetical protein
LGHRTVRCRTRQVLFTVRRAFWRCSDSARTVRALFSLQVNVGVDRCARQLLLRWHTGQSGGTPDSPVNYSGARSRTPEGEEFEVNLPWCTGHCPMAHRTVRCARPGCSSILFCSFLLNPNLFFLLVYVEPLAPVEHII